MFKWKTKDGEEINIDKLKDNHLKNIVNLLKRKNYVHTNIAYSCLSYALSDNTPEMAAYSAEMEYNNMHYSKLTNAIFEEYAERNNIEIWEV
jgi:hypothetical protein